MKSILFLSQRAYDKYHFDQIKKKHQYRFVAFLNDIYYDEFPEDQKKYFDKIYQFKTNKDAGEYSIFYLDKDDLYNAIKKELTINDNPKNYAVICIDEFNLVNGVRLSEQFGIPCWNRDILARYRDKILMKQYLHKAGIRIPRFLNFYIDQARKTPKIYYQELIEKLSNHFIIKPIAGAASIETGDIQQFSEFLEYISEAKQFTNQLEAEEYIEGTLFHCDGLINNNEIIFSHTSEYLYPNLEISKGKIIASIPCEKEDLFNLKIKQYTKEVIDTLGYINNPFHMELFKTNNDEVVFLEVAARTPGINITANYENLFGINFFDEDLLNHMLKKTRTLRKHFTCYSFVGIIPKKKGRIIKINPPEFKSRYDINWIVKEGDVIGTDAKSLIDVAGTVTVYNENYALLREDFEYLRHYEPFIMES